MGPAVPMDARWPWRRLMGAKGAAPTRRHAAPTACCAGLPPIYSCQRPWPPLAPMVPTHGLPAPTVLGVGWIRMMPTGGGFGHGVPIIGTGNGRRAIGPGAHTWAMVPIHGRRARQIPGHGGAHWSELGAHSRSGAKVLTQAPACAAAKALCPHCPGHPSALHSRRTDPWV